MPFSHGLELLNTFPEEYRTQPFWAEGQGHNNIECEMRSMFIQRCRHFLQRYVYGAQENGGDGKPLIVPVEERAVIDASDLSEHQFTINPTWVAYGKKAGKKLLSQAVGSSQQLEHECDDFADEDDIDSRNDNENLHREMEGGWGKSTGNQREDWSTGMYDNVRAVPIDQMREGSRRCLLEERGDVHNIYSAGQEDRGGSGSGSGYGNNHEEEDHVAYFERADCAIADVTGLDNDECIFMDDKNGSRNDVKRDQQQQLFKKGKKLLFSRSKGSSFASSLR